MSLASVLNEEKSHICRTEVEALMNAESSPKASLLRAERESRAFVLDTPGCVIPAFAASHPSVARFRARIPKKFFCSLQRPLTEAEGLFLLLHKDRATEYDIREDHLQCEYQGIARVEQSFENFTISCDRKFRWNYFCIPVLLCYFLTSSTAWKHRDKLPVRLKRKIKLTETKTLIEEDGVMVTCHDGTFIVYRNVHYFLQPRRSKKKRDRYKKNSYGLSEKEERCGKLVFRDREASVLVMGIDSVSRANMRRNMPRTFRLLKDDLGALDFHAFNKVADNTNPNMAASLMGLTQEELKRTCQPVNTIFDGCPLIWRNFSDAGYVTVYGEDVPSVGIFHHGRFGFLREPTDYYNRPSMLASDRYIRHSGGQGGDAALCQGGAKSISVIYDYSLSVAEAFKDLPYFALYWSTGLTHTVVEWASAADEPSVEYLRKLNASGALEHTVVFLLSDHGIRFGDIRATYAGLLEERLPFFFALLPSWFRHSYPRAWESLETNTRRLVSNFDFHVTLRDILFAGYEEAAESLPPLAHGQSLFHEIPLNRTCEDASIPEHYCTCEHTHRVDASDKRLRDAADFVVEQLNRMLLDYPDCAQLNVEQRRSRRVKSPQRLTSREGKGHDSFSDLPDYTRTSALRNNTDVVQSIIAVQYSITEDQINITSSYDTIIDQSSLTSFRNRGAQLEATVRQQDNGFELTSDVSRINQFGNQSQCIEDSFYMRFCFCRELDFDLVA
ncbi:uncharacterized protein LOC134770421 [Penaeus indicus]|uniref:uncharacterized protein LOC134770421 n=1 Tax=Penaeus indicus TaxID=29960 RepID=UPI00300CA525